MSGGAGSPATGVGFPPGTAAAASCPLCSGPGGELLWSDDRLRVIAVRDPDYPGYTRVIWHGHVAEMSDLPAPDRERILAVVNVVEEELRSLLRPDKINLASFGNMVPHVHWHVIPRFADDPHFPQSNWATPVRARDEAATERRREMAAGLAARLRERLGSGQR